MSIKKMFSHITSSFFGQKIMPKITPKIDIEDAESGNISKMFEDTELNDSTSNFDSSLEYPDLELGFGPIVEFDSDNMYVDIYMLQKHKVVDNYISFIETIRYIVSPYSYKDKVSGILRYLLFVMRNENHN